MTFSGVVLTILLTLAFVCVTLYLQKVRGRLEQSEAMVADLYNQTIEARKDEGQATKELEFLKGSIQEIMKRPVIAVLGDGQVQQVISALLTYASSINKPAKDQN